MFTTLHLLIQVRTSVHSVIVTLFQRLLNNANVGRKCFYVNEWQCDL